MKYDLHTHTKFSARCGVVEPENLVKTAISKGLNGIAVTDHDTIKGALIAKRFETRDFEVIIGCEITTKNGELIGLFLQEEIKSGAPMEVIQNIHDQGGIVVVPHPFDRFRSAMFDNINKYLEKVDAIEVYNSRCISDRSNILARDFVKKYGKEYHLSIVGGSDAHYLNEIGNAGIFTDSEDLRKAILKNEIRVFGKQSSLLNHAGTKAIKLWRKINFG
jgi:predicted metal-dependent phosphoesterase TrpH